MPQLTDLIGFLDRLLETSAFRDYGPNGVQVPGRTEVQTIVTGVSAHAELFDRAAAEGADLVLVHHGLFWRGGGVEIAPALHRRLKILFDNDMALAAYHLPLDGHPEHGNNALIADGLGCEEREPFAVHEGEAIGGRARFPGDGVGAADLVDRVRALTGRDPLHLEGGPDPVRSIG